MNRISWSGEYSSACFNLLAVVASGGLTGGGTFAGFEPPLAASLCLSLGVAVAAAAVTGGLWLLRRKFSVKQQNPLDPFPPASELLVKHSCDIIVLADDNWNIVEVNDRAVELLGYSRDELLRMSMLDLRAQEHRADFPKSISELAAKGCVTFESVALRKNGLTFPVEVHSRIVEHHGRRLDFSIVRNISERKKTEIALRESERLLREVMDSVPHFIFAKDRESRCLLVNRACATANGLTPEQMIGLRDTDYLSDKAQAEAFIKDDQEVIATGKPKFVVERLTNQVGQTRVLQTMKMPLAATGCNAPALLGVSVDITQLTRTDAALHESEERWRALMDHVPVPIQGYRNDGTVTYWNRASEELFGYSVAEAVGRKLTDLIVPQEEQKRFQQVMEAARHVVESGEFMPPAEISLHHKDGSMLFVHMTHTAVCISGLTPTLFCLNLDLTARKRAEQALLEREAHYRAVIETSADGFCMLDGEGRLLEVNDALVRRSGYSRKELLGMRIGDFEVNRTADQVAAHLERIQHKGPDLFEILHRTKDGTVWQAELDCSYWPIAEGRFFVFIRDIHRRNRSEALLRARRELSALAVRGSIDELLQRALGVAELHTGSSIGFFHFIDADQQNVSLQFWSQNTRENACQIAVKERHYPVSEAGVWVDCFHAREPVMHNDYASLAHKKGLPPGHVPLVRDLSVPVLRDGLIVAIMGVGNKATPYTQEDAEVVQALASITMDLVTRKRVEKELHRSEALYRAIARGIPDGSVFVVDHELRCLLADGSLLSKFGIEREQAEGQRLQDITRPAPPAFGEERFRCALSGEAKSYETEINGRAIWSQYVPLKDDNNRVVAAMALSIDITERKRTEKGLRLLGAALAAAANSIIITDREGIIEWVNPAFTSVTGYTLAESRGKNPRMLRSGSHDVAFYRSLWGAISAGRVWRGEMVNRRKDGTLYTAEMTITPLRDSQDQITHFIAIVQDVTEHKKLEAQLLRTQRLESVGRLASGIAHDLNNILTPMLMAPPLLRGFVHDTAMRNLVDTIESSAQRGASIIRQLLTFGRGMQSERLSLELRFQLRDMMHLIGETFPKKIVTHAKVPPELCLVNGDATQLHQVLLNLCVNARDAMPNGGTLTLGLEKVEVGEALAQANPGVQPGPYIALSVGDSGVGIPPEFLDKIFDPFFTTKKIGEGTGLGLFTVLGIVRSHGGFIQVNSTVGVGTEFKVFLPACQTECSDEHDSAQESLPMGKGELVLIVDDEHHVRQVIRQMLEGSGYRVVEAANGAEGLAVCENNRDQLRVVLTDLMMPVVDGQTMINGLREKKYDVKIIVMSGHLAEPQMLAELQTQTQAFLAKPFSVAQLLHTMESVIGS